jgi:hypothetical protein
LNKKGFNANNWFLADSAGSKSNSFTKKDPSKYVSPIAAPPLFKNNDLYQTNCESALNKFFTPGWKGESLISKDVKKFLSALTAIHKDVKDEFYKQRLSNKVRMGIFDEFISYADCKAIHFTGIDDHQTLWAEIKNKDSKFKEELDRFVEVYTFRIAVIFILKIRFIGVLLKKTNQEFDINKLVYPNSFLTGVFKQGGSKELKSKALEQNIFSWYRPNNYLKDKLISLYEICNTLIITEIIKNISIESEKIMAQKTHYSHALSHKNFGLFVNSLLINFPLWLNNFNNRFNSPFILPKDGMEVISCKFDGDFLESLSLSHWLAQENNKNIQWDQILCPDFKGSGFENGSYMSLVNELQFLTFLAQIANNQGRETTQFISNVTSGHLSNRKNSSSLQSNMDLNELSLNQSTYDRVIINVSDFPKRNIQHYLINKIEAQSECLKENGLIYLFSAKKLFVDSQKDKIDSLLSRYKLEGSFDLEELKGKGEVGSHIYIFSKAKHFERMNNHNSKQSCFNFRMNGNLESFQYFNVLTMLIQDFFFANLNDIPSMYHKEMNGFEVEFFQDAIVDGRLIHSSSKDSSKITHPLFFNNLMKSCAPFDYFFDIQAANLEGNEYSEEPIFAMTNSSRDRSPFVAIVDNRAKDNSVRVEIIHSSGLEAKAYEYGHSMCHYFDITPKWPNMDLNAIRDFIESAIGAQIVDLTFNNEARKAKANLSKLLIPKVFSTSDTIPEHIEQGVKLLSCGAEEILNLHPSNIEKQFTFIERMIGDLAKTYPMDTISKLSHFKRSITQCIDILGIKKKRNIVNFNNPIIKTPLLLSKTAPLYPSNKDVYFEFNSDVRATISKVVQKSVDDDGISREILELHSEEELILTIDSGAEMIQFLSFIFESCKGAQVSNILQSIEIPSLTDLQNIIKSFESMKRTLSAISDKITPLLERTMTQTITRK